MHRRSPGLRHDSGLLLLFLILLGSIAGVALAAAQLDLLFRNTLAKNGRWSSTKSALAMSVMGSAHFLEGTQPLSGNRLNLASWHGFQEVDFREPVTLDRAQFRFCLSESSYVVFEFDKTRLGFSAVRFSNHPDFPSAFLLVDSNGAFLRNEGLSLDRPTPGKWHDAHIAAANGRVSVLVDGQSVANFPAEIGSDRAIGFRGGLRDAFVDDIEITTRDRPSTIVETFRNGRGAWRTRGLFFLIVLTTSSALFWLLRRSGTAMRQSLFSIVAISVPLTVILTLFGGYWYSFGAKRYPSEAAARRLEETWVADETREVAQRLAQQYATKPRGDVKRILFLGTSQTWGAGAAKPSDTFVRQIESRLNQGAPGRFECINAGVSGQTASGLLEVYEQEWLDFGPELVFVILSNNDRDGERFRAALRRLAELNAIHHIETVFVLEANSPEKRAGPPPLHTVMREVAAERRIPLVDMHDFLRRRADDGFLWWDYVHLTSFGQRLVADRLSAEFVTGTAP